jgi:hypothetical protein
MTNISQRCHTPRGFSTSRFLPALGLVLLSILGCDTSDSAALRAKKALPKPEAEFNWVIMRLEHALEMFRPSGLGLQSKREMTYQLNPPNESQVNYTALVTISSKTFFRSDYLPPAKVIKKEKPEFDYNAYGNILEDDPLADPLNNPSQEYAELATKKPVIASTPTPIPSIDEVENFELAHLEGKWRLITKTASDRAQNWFDYALETSIVSRR